MQATNYTEEDLVLLRKNAFKHIKQANKGLGFHPKILNWGIRVGRDHTILVIVYLDGAARQEEYNIIL